MLVAIVALCLGLSALSVLIAPGAPSYDPWSWLVWGREILDGDLQTERGPSWKPLPVLFTAPFSVFGDAAPELWMVVARAGLFGAVAAAAAIGYRLAGWAGAVPAGVLLLVAQWLWRPTLLANSEALLILGVLAAVERHLAGKHAQAFACGVAAGLIRAEAWPFVLLYGGWLVVRDRRRAPWVIGGLALLPTLWLLPELWGSGSLSRGADRAQQPGPDAPAFTARPAWTVVKRAADLVDIVVWVGLLAGVAAVGARRVPRGALRAAAGVAALGVAWLGLVAVMTEAGFSGIDRYLLTPLAIATVLAGVGVGWALRALWTAGSPRGWRLAAAALAVVALAGAAEALRGFGTTVDFADVHQAVADDLDPAVARAGGEQRLEDCGYVYSTFLMTPAVAWTFDKHLAEVFPEGPPPGVQMRAPAMAYAGVDPPVDRVGLAPGARVLARTRHWEIEAVCGRRPRVPVD